MRTPVVDLSAIIDQVFDAVLFDMDGTLIDSTGSVERSWARWAREFGLEPLAVPHGIPARQIMADLLPAHRVEEAFRWLERIEIEDVGGLRVLPGASDTLAALPADRAAIATSCTRPLADARIAATGLAVPDVLVTASDVPVGKPDPAPYLAAAHRLGVDPARCLVVEDAPAGLIAGRAAGCVTLGLLTTHGAAELDADAIVDTLADVRLVIDGAGVRVEPVVVGGRR